MQRLSRNFLREGAVIITAGLIVAVALAGCGSGKSSTTSTPNPPQATTAGSSTHAPPPEDTATNAPAPTDTPADSTATTADNCLPSGSGAGDMTPRQRQNRILGGRRLLSAAHPL